MWDKLSQDRAKTIHTNMKGMYVCKCARHDLLPAILFLATRVKEPNKGDWSKLLKLLNYLKTTQGDIASMSANNT
jgi:hypothetical protein